LCYERVHEATLSSQFGKLNTFVLDDLEFLSIYGPLYLDDQEYRRRRVELLGDYYAFLAVAVVNCYGGTFWSYHHKRFKQIGYEFDYAAFCLALASKLVDLALNPKLTLERVTKRFREPPLTCLAAERDRLSSQGSRSKVSVGWYRVDEDA
jgi:hypothetical protein